MFILRVVLFIFFSVMALQFPALVDNYRVGCSAVVLELEQDYKKLEKISKSFNLTIEELFKEANKTKKQEAKSIVKVMGDKIPRYIKLKKQLGILESNELLSTVKIVFFQADPILKENMWNSFHFNIPMSLSVSWIFLVIIFSLLATFMSNILFFAFLKTFFIFFKKKRVKAV